MHLTLPLTGAFLFANFVLTAPVAPSSKSDDLPLPIPRNQSPGPPGYPGDPYGSTGLAGHNGNPIDNQDSAIIPDYQLVTGQKEDEDLGLYLNLESVQNPQPIRGSLGGTDPGPRMNQCYFDKGGC